MQSPTDLDRCLAILLLRRVRCSQDEVADRLHCGKLLVGSVEKWFSDQLSYQEASQLFDDHTISRVVELCLVGLGLEEQKMVNITRTTPDDILRYFRKSDYVQEREREQFIEDHRMTKEAEKTKRIESNLRLFRSSLNDWVYHYAFALSGEFGNYRRSLGDLLYGEEFKVDLHQLDNIFGGTDWRGLQIRETDESKIKEIMNYPLDIVDLRSSLEYGLRQTDRIEEQIEQFPATLNNVSERVSRIKGLSRFMKSRIELLDKWAQGQDQEDAYIIDSSSKNLIIRTNLRMVGARALDILIAIDADIQNLESINP